MATRWRFTSMSDTSVVGPDERLSWGQMSALGVQHLVAMFGSTVLAPMLMGFDTNLAILMSGVATLLFFLIVGGRIPSYLGSSFAFIPVVCAVTGYASGTGPNAAIALALGGIMACGALYAACGLLVILTGTGWILKLLPPTVTGAVVATIGLNLAPSAVSSVSGSTFDGLMALVTVLCIGSMAVLARGVLQRLLLLIGIVIAYALYFVAANLLGLGTPIDFTPVARAPWFGLPIFHAPVFELHAIVTIAPVVLILVAENLGHVKAVGEMTGSSLDRWMGRAFLGDGLATMLSGSVGGTGVTTYAENIGVMAVTRVFSTLTFLIAGVLAIVLGLSPRFGALVHTLPGPVLGGASIVVFGMISAAGVRIWMQNNVNLNDHATLILISVTMILGAGNFSLSMGVIQLNGIGTSMLAAILLNALFANRHVRNRLERGKAGRVG